MRWWELGTLYQSTGMLLREQIQELGWQRMAEGAAAWSYF